jgi:pimeloyl-ACP methyl ester carboxylesterase
MLIGRHDVVITGFLQHKGRHNGFTRLWRDLLDHPNTGQVWLLSWDDNVDHLAELIFRYSGNSTDVRIYGYSWGGMTAVLLAEALQKISASITVSHMVLCDAVYRHHYALGQWRALFPRKIWIPRNVSNVHWFRQDNPRFALHRGRPIGKLFQPAGHDVVAIDECRTRVHPETVLQVSHSWMDDQPLVYEKAMQVASLPFPEEAA